MTRRAAVPANGGRRSRSIAKSSANYKNDHWDLVDACAKDNKKLLEVTKEQLPENMREMTDEEKTAYVQVKAKERAEIQQKIQSLNEKRKEHIATKMKEQQAAGRCRF